MRWRSGRAPAQALVWFALLVPVLVLALGLVADGAVLFAAHRRALLLADGAARAGAGQLDIARLRADPTSPARLDPALARQRALGYVRRHEAAAAAEAQASAERVVVRVQLRAPTLVLHPPGADGVPVIAAAEAAPFRGIEAPRE